MIVRGWRTFSAELSEQGGVGRWAGQL